MGDWPICKGCNERLTTNKSFFRSLPPVGETGVGPAWCDECIVAGKSDAGKALVDYVKNLRQSA